MIKRILFLIVLFLSIQLSAQENKWFFSLNMGRSMPIGVFSQNSPTDLNTGFAKNGFALSLESNYAFSENFALKGMVLLNTNPINQLPVWNILNAQRETVFPVETQNQQFLSMTVNPWVTNNAMVGPNYIFLFKNIKLDVYAVGGLSLIYLPQPKLLYQNPASDVSYINRNINSSNLNFGYALGSSLRFPVSEKFDFRIALNYFRTHADQSFEQVQITRTGSSVVIQQLGKNKTSFPINNISATVGLVYYL